MQPVSSGQLATWAGEARERWSVPGVVVGVLQGGDVVTAAVGVRELGSDEPVEPDSVFRIASITKPFTATCAMTLVQAGLLDLDRPPPPSRVAATVRELLSHQGGLAQEWPEPLDGMGEDAGALLRLAEREPEALPIGPGELFSYSNAGYSLVGAAIASAAGTTFEEAMQARVLRRLGLGAAGFEPEGAVRGHEQSAPGADEHRPVDRSYPRVRRPSGGLWASIDDLLAFASHHLGGPGPLDAAAIAEMRKPLVAGPGFKCGLGWFLTRRGGRATVEHSGSAAGYQSLLILAPEEQFAFAALANSTRGMAPIKDVLERLGLGPKGRPDHPLAPAQLASFAGRYRGQGVEVEIAVDDGCLRLKASQFDPLAGETRRFPGVRARPIGDRMFEILDGEWHGDRFDFPREGLVRLSTLAARVE
jgi:CubicO group peptidase (beta-lactamase class C family)